MSAVVARGGGTAATSSSSSAAAAGGAAGGAAGAAGGAGGDDSYSHYNSGAHFLWIGDRTRNLEQVPIGTLENMGVRASVRARV